MRRSAAFRVTLLILFILLFSCASVLTKEPRSVPSPQAPMLPKTIEIQQKLAEGARYVLGRRELVIRGRRFPLDCTGTVLAIYYYAGIDLSSNFHKYRGNGVTRIYKSLEEQNLLYYNKLPLTGDIIFWDNTYDRNIDGQWNDPLTHMGMVLSSGADGTVEYVHMNYSRGIVSEYMNLLNPNVHQKLVKGELKIVNSPIRLKAPGKPHPPQWLSGQLFRILGMGYLFKG